MARTVPHWLLPGELAMLDAPGERPVRRTARDWATDAMLFLVAAAFWAQTVAAEPPYYSHAVPDWMRAADPYVGAVACLVLWWRRRLPVGIAVGVLAALMVADSALGASLVMVLTVAVHREWPTASLVTVAYLIPTLGFMALHPQPGLPRWVGMVLTALMYLVPLGWGMAVRGRRQLTVSLRRDAERERAEHALRLAGARRGERERIAREMHDVLAHRVSLISVHAGALAYRTRQADAGAGRPLDPAEVGSAIEVISDNARHALVELRDVLSVLREDDPSRRESPQPTVADLERLVAEARTAGHQIGYAARLDGSETLPPSLQRTLYRTVQEGLTNARKHAPGARADVAVTVVRDKEIVVSVRNPVPPDTAAAIPGAGAGLAGLAERVALDGGTVEHAVSGGVFRLTARIPWPS